MDYINYVKEYPLQGLTGLYGGVQGALQQAAGGGGTNYGDRAVGYSGEYPGNQGSVIDYFDITTTGNASDFGSANETSSRTKGGGSTTRGLKGGGDPNNQAIEYITYASTSNGTDFGDLAYQRNYVTSGGNGTRQLFMGGQPSGLNTAEYVTIANTGNASNFGDITPVFSPGSRSGGGGGNATRVVHMGSDSPRVTTIGYFTAMTTGNCTNFGTLTQNASYVGSAYNETRAWRMGGYTNPSRTITTDSITIDTTSNATTWGDLIQIWRYSSGCSNGPRFVNMGGDDGQGMGSGETGYYNNTIQYFNSDSTGNASNFGNLYNGRNGLAAMSGKP